MMLRSSGRVQMAIPDTRLHGEGEIVALTTSDQRDQLKKLFTAPFREPE